MTKKILFLLALLPLLLVSADNPSGIHFIKDNFELALKNAAEQKKLIFMDTYAVWCGPCKEMDRKVFSSEKLSGYFNEQFVNLKVDIDTKEGKVIKNRFAIRSIPSMFFLNARGEIVDKVVGFQTEDQLLERAQKVLAKNQ